MLAVAREAAAMLDVEGTDTTMRVSNCEVKGWRLCSLMTSGGATEDAILGVNGVVYIFYRLRVSHLDEEGRKDTRKLTPMNDGSPYPDEYFRKVIKYLKDLAG
jgi:hypothetical protein